MKKLLIIMFLFAISNTIYALNNKTGISISFPGSTENVDYAIEQLYYDELYDDHSIIYVKNSNTFTMALAHNANNTDWSGNATTGGNIRCMFDGDELYRYDYNSRYYETDSRNYAEPQGIVWNYNNTPFTIAQKSKGTGTNGYASDNYYHCHYGMTDSFGDEWHTLTYWDDDRSDGKIVYLVSNVKTPVISFSASGSDQYYSTPPKAYYNPVIRNQTTYLTAGVVINLTNITNTNQVEYRIDSGTWQNYPGPQAAYNYPFQNNTVHDFEFRIAGSAYTKTRKIHYNPAKPSASEAHPVLLHTDSNKSIINTRIQDNTQHIYFHTENNSVYADTYLDSMQNRYNDFKGYVDLAENHRQGLRFGSQERHKGREASHAGLVWQMENDSAYADQAKAILLSYTYDLIFACFAYQEQIVPEFEVSKNWYNVTWIYAYDYIADYPGLTAIEDYKIRDNLANMIRTLMLRSWYMNNHNHNFNTYNMMAAAAIAMPTYDSVYGHAIGADRSGNAATTLEPTPSWFNAIYDEATNNNAPGEPGYNKNGFWGLFRESGLVQEGSHYIVYKLYGLIQHYALFLLHYNGRNIIDEELRYKNFVLRHIYLRRPSDGYHVPYNQVRTTDGTEEALFFWKFINKIFDVEYIEGKKLNELARFNYDFLLDNNYYVSLGGLYHGDRESGNIQVDYFSMFDKDIPAETDPKDAMFFNAGYSLYSDITNPESIYLYQHGEDHLDHNQYWHRADNLCIHLDAYGERFTASVEEYRAMGDIASPQLYNNVIVDGDFDGSADNSIGRFTEAETYKIFDNSYMNYGSVRTNTNSPLDDTAFVDNMQQTRHIFFPDNKYIVMIDNMRSLNAASHQYDWMFNGYGTVSMINNGFGKVEKGAGEPKLDIYLAGADHTLTTGSLEARTGHLKATVNSAQDHDFMAVLYPLDSGAASPTVQDISGANYYAQKITVGSDEMVAMCQKTPSNLTYENINTDAQIALVKRIGGNLDYFQVNNATIAVINSLTYMKSTEPINFSYKKYSTSATYRITNAQSANSTSLTIGGLSPDSTYSLIDNEITDYYGNKTQVAQFAFQTDALGQYTYTQNCSRHEIIIELLGTGNLGTLSGTVTDSDTSDPISGALVTAKQGSTVYGSAITDASGNYSINLVVGTYDVTAAATMYVSGTQTSQNIQDSQTTDVDFSIDPYVDTTPPTDPAQVRDGSSVDIDYTYATTHLSANWDNSSDPETGIVKYYYAIGTVPNGTDVLFWTDNGLNTSIYRPGLSLSIGSTYYFTVKSQNGFGTFSNHVISDGQCVIEIPPKDPLAHWKFEEGSGTTITDSSGNNYSGTIQGATYSADNYEGNHSLSFNGNSDFIDAGSFDIQNSNEMTIALWFKADNYNSTHARFISKATGTGEQDHYWMLGTTDQGGNIRLRCRLKAGGDTDTCIASSGNLQPNVWTHVAFVYDGSSIKLFKDGVLAGSWAKTGNIDMDNSVDINIGRNPDGSNYFDGAIDDVRIYDKALTEQEIANIVFPPAQSPQNPNNPSNPSTDIESPVISGVRIVGIGSDKATILWSTDEETTSRIEYGTDVNYGSTSALDTNLTLGHSVTLTGLTIGTRYHLRVLSSDGSGNGAVSSDYTFTTAVDEAEAKSWPNPYEYSENNPMTFEFPGVDNGGTIKMYTIAGKLIKTIELPVGEIRIQWDGKDENGFVVASGVYIYVLTTAEGKIKKGKFAFIK